MTTSALLADEAQQQRREQANLLYVALTRAKQFLYVSGCQSKRTSEHSWYDLLVRQIGDRDMIAQQGWLITTGNPPATASKAVSTKPALVIDPALSLPLPPTNLDAAIAPSQGTVVAEDASGDEHGRERGLVIHRCLQLLTEGGGENSATLQKQVAAAFNLDDATLPIPQWLTEAQTTVHNPSFRDWFDPTRYDRTYNEVPIYYYRGKSLVHGVIDRLVIKGDTCLLIDYKTQREASPANIEKLAAPYREQMSLYKEGVQRLWPQKTMHTYLLFTASGQSYCWE